MGSWLDISSEVHYIPETPILFSFNLVHDFREIYWITASYSSANRMRTGGGTHELQIAYSWN